MCRFAYIVTIVAIVVGVSGCSIKRVMKDCAYVEKHEAWLCNE